MPIDIAEVALSTQIIIIVLIVAILLGCRKTQHSDLFSIGVTNELKGFAMLSIVFAHISYLLVSDGTFLFPLSIASGIGVDLFLLMSGYGLTLGMLKKPLSALEFYKRRLIKVFIPFWIVISLLFIADALFLNIHYSSAYLIDALPWLPLPDTDNRFFWQMVYYIQSYLGIFLRADAYIDINSPFWYITWLLMFYCIFPFVFNAQKPWISAVILSVLANALAITDPLNLSVNWLHRLHTNAFSIGIILAWLLHTPSTSNNVLVENLQWFRNKSGGIGRYCLISLALAAAAYVTYYSTENDWPNIAHALTSIELNSKFVIGQASGLFGMCMLLIVFSLKRLDNKLLAVFGVYSYETYLVHWPLMYRYDILFEYLPAWLAVIIWLATFLVIGWILQKITTPLGVWIDSKL